VHTLSAFIRGNKERIIDEWAMAVKRLPSAHTLSELAIRDHVPEIRDRLADAIDREDMTSIPLMGVPNLHAALRVREGYDLRQVVAEYRTLRRVIHELYSEDGDINPESRSKMPPLRVMHAAIDAAICGRGRSVFCRSRPCARNVHWNARTRPP
jgi:hypothetical protein